MANTDHDLERSSFVAAPGLEHSGPREVGALLRRPRDASFFLVLGHGAGSSMTHPLMVDLAAALANVSVATLRFNYPYSERGGGMSPQPVRLATVRSAAALGASLAGDLPLFVGGHSMSGRMFSMTEADCPLEGVKGVVLFAFPLRSGDESRRRTQHLRRVQRPMLFLSGDRDKLADAALLREVVSGLPRARLIGIETADHGFKTLKRRENPTSATDELAQHCAAFMRETALRS